MHVQDGLFCVNIQEKEGEIAQSFFFHTSGKIWIPCVSPDFSEEKLESFLRMQEWPAVWQIPSWQHMLLRAGSCDAVYCIFEEKNDEIIAFSYIQVRKVSSAHVGLFCVGGPVGNFSSSERFLTALRYLGESLGAVFLQVEPMENISYTRHWKKGKYKRLFEEWTAWVDLTKTSDEILKTMKEKGRYNIRLSQKHGVVVDQVPATPENVVTFKNLLDETTSRDGFAGNALAYYQNMFSYLEDYRMGGLYFARKDEKVIAAGVFVFFGKLAIYYYGASTSDNALRRFMPAYALQWKAMQDAQSRGVHVFDFLGIDAPQTRNGSLSGVTDFKMKFGPHIRQWPEAHIRILRKTPWIGISLRQKLKHLLRFLKK